MLVNNQAIINAFTAGQRRMLAQFNAITGAFIALHELANESVLNKDYFTYLEVTIDPNQEVVIGTYPDVQVVNKTDTQVVFYESAMNNAAKSKIFKEYDLIDQLNVMNLCIQQLLEKAGITVPEFTEMNSYIQEVIRTNNLRKETVAADPNFTYISKEQEYEQYNLRLEGGLHEELGPREISPSGVSGAAV